MFNVEKNNFTTTVYSQICIALTLKFINLDAVVFSFTDYTVCLICLATHLYIVYKRIYHNHYVFNQKFPSQYFCFFLHISNNLIAIASLFEDVVPQLGCLNAAALFHNTLLHSILRAPAEFFDTTPCGRILARFSKDIEVMDSTLPHLISDCVYFVFMVNI